MNIRSIKTALIIVRIFVAGRKAKAAQSLSEDFNGNTLPSSLEIVLPTGTSAAPSFQNGEVVFPGGDTAFSRSYVRTIATDFSGADFEAEITVSESGQIVNLAGLNAFFGMGVGDADASASFGAEPRADPHVFLLMNMSDAISQNGLVDDSGEPRVDTPGIAGPGTHRVRLSWDSASEMARFRVDRDFNGIDFVPDFDSGLIDGSDNGFNATNTTLFFGGSLDVSFDDLSVTVVPEPSSIAIAALAFLAFQMALLSRARG